MPGRNASSNDYRYGYQGSEKDDEVKGITGSQYTTFFRGLDPRVGRWWSVDPKFDAGESPYVSMGNNPIWSNDILGDKFINIHTKRKESAKVKRDNANKNLTTAKDDFKDFDGLKLKDAKALGRKKEFKTKKKALNNSQREFDKADKIFKQEELFESIVNEALEKFKSVNPEKFEEFDNFDPFNLGIIDIDISAQNNRIRKLDANGNPTQNTTNEGITARFSRDQSKSFVKLRLVVIKSNGVVQIQSMTSLLVHGLGHIVGGKRRDEAFAKDYQKTQFDDKIKK